MGSPCRICYSLCEKLIAHEMRAGAGCKESAILHKLHSKRIDLSVSLGRILNRIPGLGKCRRIKDNKAIPLPFRYLRRQEFKYIRALISDAVFNMIESRISRSCCQCGFRSINGEHALCSRKSGIKPEGTCMCKAVQYIHTLCHRPDCLTVVLLIQEKSRLLTVLYINNIFHIILCDADIRIKLFSYEAFCLLKALFFTFFCITAFIDAPDNDTVFSHYLL